LNGCESFELGRKAFRWCEPRSGRSRRGKKLGIVGRIDYTLEVDAKEEQSSGYGYLNGARKKAVSRHGKVFFLRLLSMRPILIQRIRKF
jgi:hypothetical protein